MTYKDVRHVLSPLVQIILFCETYLDIELEPRKVAKRHRMEGIVVRGRVELQQHVRPGTDDVRHNVTATQSH